MNYNILGVSFFATAIILLLLWLWYLERQRREIPELIRTWRKDRKLSTEEAAEEISQLLRQMFPKYRDREDYDPKTIKRWESGKTLPSLQTALMVKQAISGANYVQMQQTLANGTKSYAAFFATDELTDTDQDDLLYQSHERSYKKGLISEEDWRAYKERRAADYKASAQRQSARKRGRPRKKKHQPK